MRLLLDTHVAVCWLNTPETLRAEARSALEGESSELVLSAASVWEAGITQSVGRFHPPAPLDESAGRSGLLELHVSWAHARSAAELHVCTEIRSIGCSLPRPCSRAWFL